MKKKLFLVAIILLMVLSACTGTDASPEMLPAETAASSSPNASTATTEPTQTKIITAPPLFEAESLQDMLTPVPTWTPTLTPTPELKNVRILTEGNGMQSPGPWLLFTTTSGVFIVSEDGSEIGYIPVETNNLWWTVTVAPSGGIYTQYEFLHGDFMVRTVATNEVLYRTNLLDYPEPALEFEDEYGEYEFDRDRHYAVGEITWAHSGDAFTFIGSLDGHSPDLYTFTLNTGNVTRITSTDLIEVNPYWSPDDSHLFYGNVRTLNAEKSGRGYGDWELYSSNSSGASPTFLFSGLEYGEERFWGWYSNDWALMSSEIWWCGQFDLRLVNIQNGATQQIIPGNFGAVGYNPDKQIALLSVPQQNTPEEECVPEMDSGLYFVSIPGGSMTRLDFESEDYIYSINWDENARKFLVEFLDDWAVVDLAGTATIYEDQPIMSPNGEWIAFLSDNRLYVTDRDGNREIRLINGREVNYPVWSLDGETLFYFYKTKSDNKFDLYFAQAPNFEPVLLTNGLSMIDHNPPQWVLP